MKRSPRNNSSRDDFSAATTKRRDASSTHVSQAGLVQSRGSISLWVSLRSPPPLGQHPSPRRGTIKATEIAIARRHARDSYRVRHLLLARAHARASLSNFSFGAPALFLMKQYIYRACTRAAILLRLFLARYKHAELLPWRVVIVSLVDATRVARIAEADEQDPRHTRR